MTDVIEVLPEGPHPFEFPSYESLAPTLLDSLTEDQLAEPDLLISFPSRMPTYLGDTLSADSKFLHVLDCARDSIARGALTWGTVDGYHASLLGAKAVLAHFGVISYGSGDRSVLIDYFPELGSPDHRKRFQKENRGKTDLVRVMRPTRARLLEQADVWKLIERIVNLRAFATSEEEATLIALREAIKNRPWRVRNDILYNTVGWRWKFDIGLAPLAADARDTLMRVEDPEVAEFIDFVDAIYTLLEGYRTQLMTATSLTALSVPPGLQGCSIPNVLN